ncbi:MAG: PTS fructose transporter subunit IIB [Bacillus sp. (in: firmicutes)]
MKLVGVTSCHNGVAFTYMAAENLLRAAFQLDVDMKIEMQGTFGTESELTEEDIKNADGVIIATDREVDLSRFTGKPLLQVDIHDGIRIPRQLIKKFEHNEVPVLN